MIMAASALDRINILKIKDDSGHEHDNKGKFTSGGGGGKKPDKSKGRKPIGEKPRAQKPARLSPKEQAAVEHYTSDGFLDIKSFLRGTEEFDDHKQQQLKTVIGRLDSALDKSTIPPDVKTVYRGLDHKELYKNLSRLKGAVITDPSYASTSTNVHVAEDYGSGVHGCVMEITVPNGSKGLDVNKKGLAGNKHEKEILLPRESQFRVISTELRGHVGYIRAELVQAA